LALAALAALVKVGQTQQMEAIAFFQALLLPAVDEETRPTLV
jgi:hypothetical protein